MLKYRTAGTQRLNGTALTNEGTVEWDGGNMSFGNGSVLTNKSVVDAKTDHVMNYFGGSNGSFINKGTLRKSGGAGETRIDTIVFSNEGILDAQTGTLRYNSAGGQTFKAGSQFQGAGQHLVTNNASFEGMQNILGNLRIASGTSTGVGAVVAGTLDYTGGDLSGTWTVQGLSLIHI